MKKYIFILLLLTVSLFSFGQKKGNWFLARDSIITPVLKVDTIQSDSNIVVQGDTIKALNTYFEVGGINLDEGSTFSRDSVYRYNIDSSIVNRSELGDSLVLKAKLNGDTTVDFGAKNLTVVDSLIAKGIFKIGDSIVDGTLDVFSIPAIDTNQRNGTKYDDDTTLQAAKSYTDQEITNSGHISFTDTTTTIATQKYVDDNGGASSSGIVNDIQMSDGAGGLVNTTDINSGSGFNWDGKSLIMYDKGGANNLMIGAPNITTTGYRNTTLGDSSGQFITTGTDNTLVGYQSGDAIVDGNYNSVFGSQTGTSINSGSWNSLFGYGAGKSITSGYNNVMIGYNAGDAVTTGYDNVNIGRDAGTASTTNGSVYIGTRSGWAATVSSGNVFTGYQAGYSNTGSNNVFYGYNAGGNSTTSGDCVFIGSNAGLSSEGDENVFIGLSAGYSNTTGIENTFIGANAGYFTTGSYNISIGSGSAQNLSSGTNNVIIGVNAGANGGTSALNVLIGNSAGAQISASNSIVAIGDHALGSSTTGSKSVVIGRDAAETSTGTENVIIGYLTGKNAITTGSVLIGHRVGENLSGLYKLYIDNSSTSTPLVEGDFSANTFKINGIVIESTNTIADNDATPSVAGSNVWTYNGTANAVVVTDLDAPKVGSIVRIIGNSDTYTITINDGGNFNLSANWVGGLDDVLTLFVQADNDYIEISRSNN